MGRRLTYELRDIVGAIFYVLRTGAQWRLLPHEYPPWRAVYYHFAKWRRDGEPSVRAALRRKVLRAENSAYGQPYDQCLREA